MKKFFKYFVFLRSILFLFVTTFLFSACEPYTVENGYSERISAGSVVIMPYQCVELFNFPFVGDFPLRFRYADRGFISTENQPPGHYFISSEGEILNREEPCEKDFSIVRPEPPTEDFDEPPPQTFIFVIEPVFEINLNGQNPSTSEESKPPCRRNPSTNSSPSFCEQSAGNREGNFLNQDKCDDEPFSQKPSSSYKIGSAFPSPHTDCHFNTQQEGKRELPPCNKTHSDKAPQRGFNGHPPCPAENIGYKYNFY